MGVWRSIKKFFVPVHDGEEEGDSPPSPRRKKRTIRPVEKDEYMSAKPNRDHEEAYSEPVSYGGSREIMSPELIKSFNEFQHLLHNINIKMASQNDQNMALLRSLESLPAIIKDIPRARELEGDVLQEIAILLKDSRNDKLKMTDRLSDVKTAMMAMEENGRAQISYFEGKERAHREQMNMMREYMDRERKHHRNNLTGVFLITVLFIGMICAAGYFILQFQLKDTLRDMERDLESRTVKPQIMYVPAPAEPVREETVAAPVAPPDMAPVMTPDTPPASGGGNGASDSSSNGNGKQPAANGGTPDSAVPFE